MAAGCSILRLRGLPYSASEGDIKLFFEGFELTGTHINFRNGKPTGEAYVQFKTPDDAANALKKKNHEHLGSRYIEIFESLEAGLVAQNLGGSAAAPSLEGHVVRLRGLPFASSAQDILQFFEGIELTGGEAGVIFTCTPDGRPAGEAYVELASAEAKQAALAKHKDKIGTRYIEIFDSSKGDMYQAVQQYGCFSAVGGKRRHHWPAGSGQHATQQSGGHFGDVMGVGRGPRGQQNHDLDLMAAAFAGFGISPHDVQVPGPPRAAFLPFGAAPAEDARQYGARPGPQGQVGGVHTHWRPPSQPLQASAHPGPRAAPHFSRAPGPPSGKNSLGRDGGNRQQPGMTGGGGGGLFDYGATPPLMMQPPFMLQPPPFMHPQQPGSPWAAAMMASQQSGGWFAGGMPGGGTGRGGHHLGPMPPNAFTGFGPQGYYVRSPGMSHGMGPPSGTSPLNLPQLPIPQHPRTPPSHYGPGAAGGLELGAAGVALAQAPPRATHIIQLPQGSRRVCCPPCCRA